MCVQRVRQLTIKRLSALKRIRQISTFHRFRWFFPWTSIIISHKEISHLLRSMWFFSLLARRFTRWPQNYPIYLRGIYNFSIHSELGQQTWTIPTAWFLRRLRKENKCLNTHDALLLLVENIVLLLMWYQCYSAMVRKCRPTNNLVSKLGRFQKPGFSDDSGRKTNA